MKKAKDVKEEKWDKVISTDSNGFRIDLKRIWEYRDLVALFVKRDFIVYYKQTILGPLWYLIQPILSTLMYMVVFGRLANIGTDSIPKPLFYFSGTMLWTYFSGVLLETSGVFTSNKDVFGKIYFPRLTVPIAKMISLLIKFLIQFFLFIVILIYYMLKGMEIVFSYHMLLIPIIILWIGLLGCGLGMIISSITTKYRDLAMALNFLVSLFMYVTPVAYPLSEVPVEWKIPFFLNPVCMPMELFRYSLFRVASLNLWAVVYSILFGIIIVWSGLLVFNKVEKSFIDVI